MRGFELSGKQFQDQGFLFELEEHVRKRVGALEQELFKISPLDEEVDLPDVHIRLRRRAGWWDNVLEFFRVRR